MVKRQGCGASDRTRVTITRADKDNQCSEKNVNDVPIDPGATWTTWWACEHIAQASSLRGRERYVWPSEASKSTVTHHIIEDAPNKTYCRMVSHTQVYRKTHRSKPWYWDYQTSLICWIYTRYVGRMAHSHYIPAQHCWARGTVITHAAPKPWLNVHWVQCNMEAELNMIDYGVFYLLYFFFAGIKHSSWHFVFERMNVGFR